MIDSGGKNTTRTNFLASSTGDALLSKVTAAIDYRDRILNALMGAIQSFTR